MQYSNANSSAISRDTIHYTPSRLPPATVYPTSRLQFDLNRTLPQDLWLWSRYVDDRRGAVSRCRPAIQDQWKPPAQLSLHIVGAAGIRPSVQIRTGRRKRLSELPDQVAYLVVI